MGCHLSKAATEGSGDEGGKGKKPRRGKRKPFRGTTKRAPGKQRRKNQEQEQRDSASDDGGTSERVKREKSPLPQSKQNSPMPSPQPYNLQAEAVQEQKALPALDIEADERRRSSFGVTPVSAGAEAKMSRLRQNVNSAESSRDGPVSGTQAPAKSRGKSAPSNPFLPPLGDFDELRKNSTASKRSVSRPNSSGAPIAPTQSGSVSASRKPHSSPYISELRFGGMKTGKVDRIRKWIDNADSYALLDPQDVEMQKIRESQRESFSSPTTASSDKGTGPLTGSSESEEQDPSDASQASSTGPIPPSNQDTPSSDPPASDAAPDSHPTPAPTPTPPLLPQAQGQQARKSFTTDQHQAGLLSPHPPSRSAGATEKPRRQKTAPKVLIAETA